MTYVPIQGKCPVCHQDSANTVFQAGAASRDAEIATLREQLAAANTLIRAYRAEFGKAGVSWKIVAVEPKP